MTTQIISKIEVIRELKKAENCYKETYESSLNCAKICREQRREVGFKNEGEYLRDAGYCRWNYERLASVIKNLDKIIGQYLYSREMGEVVNSISILSDENSIVRSLENRLREALK